MTWFITYIFMYKDNKTEKSIQPFAYNPTDEDIDEVGNMIMTEFNAISFIAYRGR